MTERRREDETKPPQETSEERDFADRLKQARARAGLEPKPQGPPPPLGLASYALRLATELVAGVAVGGFIGWWIDKVAGTSPFGVIACVVLGFAAGLLNVVRAVRKINAQQAAAHQVPPESRDEPDED